MQALSETPCPSCGSRFNRREERARGKYRDRAVLAKTGALQTVKALRGDRRSGTQRSGPVQGEGNLAIEANVMVLGMLSNRDRETKYSLSAWPPPPP